MSTRAQPRSAASSSSAPAPPPRRATGPRRSPPGAARRRRRLLVVGIVVAAVVAIAYGITRSPLLSVDTLQVRGTSHLTPAQVTAAAGIHDGDAMTWIDTGVAVDGIEALPYVRNATLEREWPQTVRINVRERTPSAWIDTPTGKALVDRTGRVLEVVADAPQGMPQLVGVTLVPPPGGTVDAIGAARVAGALTGLAAVGTASVEATDHGIVLHLRSGPEIRMGAATEIGVKVRAALAVLGASAARPLTYVDVSTPTNPVTD